MAFGRNMGAGGLLNMAANIIRLGSAINADSFADATSAVRGMRDARKIGRLASGTEEMDATELVNALGTEWGALRRRGISDFAGVYVLTNKRNGKRYVGQSIHVLERVREHFTGDGCRDAWDDYRRGDRFGVRTLPLRGSGFPDLDTFERKAIAAYGAYEVGYNKTRGNGIG